MNLGPDVSEHIPLLWPSLGAGKLADGRMPGLRCATTAQQIPLLQHTPGTRGFVFCTGREEKTWQLWKKQELTLL